MKETLHIYTRVSTDVQEEKGTSLESQSQLGKQYAKEHGFKVKLWNEGSATSRDSWENRSVLVQLLGEVDEGNVKHVYVWNTDRLSRNRLSSAIIQDKFEKNGVTLHTKSGSRDLTDSHDKLLLDLLRAVATFDNELRTERFRLGKLSKIRQGFWIGGTPPYGYDLGTNKKLVVNKEESKWVKEIFKLYNKGYSPDRIRQVLLDNNVTTKRGKVIWSDGSVSSVLRNTHYIGHYDYVDKKTGEKIRSNCPTIITTKTYEKFLEVSSKRKKISKFDKVGNSKSTNLSRKQKRVYLLTDLLVCGGCESLFTGNYQNKRTSQYRCRSVWRRYRNTNPDYVDCKYKRTLRMDITDDLVWNNVIDVLEKSNLYREKVKQSLLPSNELMKEKRETVDKNNKRIRKLKTELDKIEDAITKQQTTRLLVENTKQVDGIIKELDKRRIETLSGIETLTEENQTNVKVDEWIDWYKSFGDKINDLRKISLTIEEKNQFITGVVKSIEVIEKSLTEHELRIEFREPFVGDKLVWNNVKKKSLGYKLKNGRKKMTIKGVLSSKK